MVFTLHRYIFRELIKVFALSSIAMTLMISTMMMLRPIQKYGVPPEQVIYLFSYFLPITLTFVLPIAAIFASALVYGRFASDNELDACRASGVSLMTLIYPGLCLAIAIAITTLILSFYVVPSFVHRAQKSIKANVKQLLFRNIQRKGFYSFGKGYHIYADNAYPEQDLLTGTIVIKARKSSADMMITTDKTLVQIETGQDENQITIVAENFNMIDEFGQQSKQGLVPIETSVPSLLSDEIKFQKIDRIKEIKRDMMKFARVKDRTMDTRAQLITEMLALEMNRKFENLDDQLNPQAINIDGLYTLTNNIKKFVFTAKQCIPLNKWKIEIIGPIKLFEVDKVLDKLICTYQCESAFIELSDDSSDAKFEMFLENPAWERADSRKGIAVKKAMRELAIPVTITSQIDENNLYLDIPNVPQRVGLEPTPDLTTLIEELNHEIWLTKKSIIAEVNSRLVFGLGCISIVLISIALGIKFRGGHLLSAFGASAIPAGILVVFMMSGKHLTTTENTSIPEITGTIVMWTGLFLLSAGALWIYRQLLKT